MFPSFEAEHPEDVIINQEILMLKQERDRLLAAIKEHHSQKADDRCRLDDDRLYAAAGLPPCDRRVGDKFEMAKNCLRFIDRRCESGGWPTYVEMETENSRLKFNLDNAEFLIRKNIKDFADVYTELLELRKKNAELKSEVEKFTTFCDIPIHEAREIVMNEVKRRKMASMSYQKMLAEQNRKQEQGPNDPGGQL